MQDCALPFRMAALSGGLNALPAPRPDPFVTLLSCVISFGSNSNSGQEGLAKKYDGVALPPVYQRKLYLLKLQLTLPTPSDPALLHEENALKTDMQSTYGKGKYCPASKPGTCYDLTAMEKLMGESHDPDELKDLWIGWHKVSPPMRPKFARFVELANQGAREQGYADM